MAAYVQRYGQFSLPLPWEGPWVVNKRDDNTTATAVANDIAPQTLATTIAALTPPGRLVATSASADGSKLQMTGLTADTLIGAQICPVTGSNAHKPQHLDGLGRIGGNTTAQANNITKDKTLAAYSSVFANGDIAEIGLSGRTLPPEANALEASVNMLITGGTAPSVTLALYAWQQKPGQSDYALGAWYGPVTKTGQGDGAQVLFTDLVPGTEYVLIVTTVDLGGGSLDADSHIRVTVRPFHKD